MSENTNANVSIGQTVSINPRNDRSRRKLVTGIVSEILTKNLSHPHGILVKLENGEIGRVKSEEQQTNQVSVGTQEDKKQKSDSLPTHGESVILP